MYLDLPRAMGTHSRPDVDLGQRLYGIKRLIGKAEVIGVDDVEGDYVTYVSVEL